MRNQLIILEIDAGRKRTSCSILLLWTVPLGKSDNRWGEISLYTNISANKWWRNNGIRIWPFCNPRLIERSKHRAPRAANIRKRETSEKDIRRGSPLDERTQHHRGPAKRVEPGSDQASGPAANLQQTQRKRNMLTCLESAAAKPRPQEILQVNFLGFAQEIITYYRGNKEEGWRRKV